MIALGEDGRDDAREDGLSTSTERFSTPGCTLRTAYRSENVLRHKSNGPNSPAKTPTANQGEKPASSSKPPLPGGRPRPMLSTLFALPSNNEAALWFPTAFVIAVTFVSGVSFRNS